MIRNRIFLKTVAILLIIEIVGNTVWPTVSYALTSGPTAPEATSFEPVDTTDMVNLATGDLAYNIPLLEVPGPAGSYPLSLSYHAGIMPNEEASWVGLGWTLNPGAINRSVNGFADDHNGALNTDRFFWSGGERHSFEIGVTAGVAGVAGVSAGISVSHDTYQGFGVGGNVGLSIGIKGSLGLNMSIGVDGYGNPNASLGLGLGIGDSEKAIGGSLGLGISAGGSGGSLSGYASGGISADYSKPDSKATALSPGSASLVGASISTQKGSGAIRAVGTSMVHNSKTGKVTTSSAGFTLPLPFISLGFSYQRYWIDEMEKVTTFGSLYNPKTVVEESFNRKAFDSYSLLDASKVDRLMSMDPDKQMGGGFLGFDSYMVNAQGLSGGIRPYAYKSLIFRQNRKEDGDYLIKQVPYQQAEYQTDKMEFRFVNDFANKYLKTSGSIIASANTTPPASIAVGAGEVTGMFANGYLPGSRHIEWYTNKQILGLDGIDPSSTGFRDCQATGFSRSTTGSLGDQIGGFKITNESGVVYHFALPAYVYNEYQRTENIKRTDGKTFSEYVKKEPYAYTWYLTAVTGPDYVDRGPNGIPDEILNEYDFGYWVSFEYGKWTDSYAWRNPAQGMTKDIDLNFKNFSEGLKELYYLDAIKTATHTAFFAKEIRHDSKSTIYADRNITGMISFGEEEEKRKIDGVTKQGGFIPKRVTNTCEINYVADPLEGIENKDMGSIEYYARPVSSLKLVSVFLVENKKLETLNVSKSNGIEYSQGDSDEWVKTKDSNWPGELNCDFTDRIVNNHYYQNVFDVFDLATSAAQLESVSTKVIEFNSSNDGLVPETENSFDYELAKGDIPNQDPAAYTLKSKLTLHSLTFKGKGGVQLLPSTKFDYELPEPVAGNNFFNARPDGLFRVNASNTGVILGDILKVQSLDRTCYAVVIETQNSYFDVKVVGSKTPYSNVSSQWSTTKNPPYKRDYFDLWGHFKSDYIESEQDINENFARRVTEISKRSLDVWSLRKITSPLGSSIEIEYEPHQYRSAYFDESQHPWIKSLTPLPTPGYLDLELPEGYNTSSGFSVGNEFDLYAYFGNRTGDVAGNKKFFVHIYAPNSGVFSPPAEYSKSLVTEIEGQHLTIYNTRLYGAMTMPHALYSGLEYDFLGGNAKQSEVAESYGGGIRVKSITVHSERGESSTSYEYEEGVTSYSPLTSHAIHLEFPDNDYYRGSNTGVESYLARFLNSTLMDLLSVSREVPPPGVIYTQVRVSETVNSNLVEGYSEYEFVTFKKDFVVLSPQPIEDTPTDVQYNNIHVSKIRTRDVSIKTMADFAGKLKRITLYDRHGNKINETINNYLFDDVDPELNPAQKMSEYESMLTGFDDQGVIHETTFDLRFLRSYPNYNILGVVSRRHKVPVIELGQTVTNYKTGIKTESRILAFDLYSGQTVKTRSSDGYGNHFITEITPAYHKYPSMGPAANGGYNMLSQEATSVTYKVSDDNAIQGLVSASAQTWSDKNMIFDYPELSAPVVLSTFGVAVSGIHTATSPEAGAHLSEADRIEFLYNGVTCRAFVEKATLRQNQHYWEYQMRISGGEAPETSLSNLTVVKITVPRKRASYAYIGEDNLSLRADGLHTLINDQLPAFTAWSPGDPTPSGWQKNSEITLYDVYSHALEASDLNGQFAATKMTPDQTRVSATVANATYNEFTYSGAEEGATGSSLGNSVTLGTGATLSTSIAHSGFGAVKSSNQGFFTEADVTPGKKYTVSVWASKSSATMKWVDGTGTTGTDVVLQLKRRAGDWYLLTGTVQPTQTHMKVWSQANGEETHFDDFRFHPFDAAMMSYVYNSWGELSHILDNNNLYTEYRYDAMGRLTSTYKETFMTPQEQARYGNNGIVKVSEVNYNYGANNPFMLPLTFAKSGSTGDIVYTGLPQVQQRKSFTFEIKENCPTPKFASLMIDNQLINTAIPTHTLLDGTIVKVNGKVVTLENVISPHTIYVTFNDFSNTGRAACFVVPRINEFGNTVYCRDGSFEYWYYNGCGEEQQRIRVYDINQVPTELRGYLPAEGCTVESGTNCVGNLDQ